MEAGVKTDMITGRPVELVDRLQHQAKADRDKLNSDVAKLGLSQSADGRYLQAMLEKVALRRIEDLIKDDPEMIAYVNILKEIGNTENLARRAYQAIHGRFIKDIE
jgi:hypothetical protein